MWGKAEPPPSPPSSLPPCLPCQAMKPPGAPGSQSTYSDLLSVIEEMGREIRPTYAGSKSAMERLKRGTEPGGGPLCTSPPPQPGPRCLTSCRPPPSGIIHARALVRECLAETERNART